MSRYQGDAAASSSGVVVGRVQILVSGESPVEERTLQAHEVLQEQARLDTAIKRASEELQRESQQVTQAGHHEVAAILEAHRLMLDDPEFTGRVRQRISDEQLNAEWALRKHLNLLQRLFATMEDEYFRERFQDVWHLGQRLLQHLSAQQPLTPIAQHEDSTIFVTLDISPSDVINLWRMGAAGVIADQGGVNAHAIIIARGIGLPMLVGTRTLCKQVEDGDCIILDAERNCYVLDPNQQDLEHSRAFMSAMAAVRHDLQYFAKRPSLSKDHQPLALMANIEFAEEIAAVRAVGADGVGLFRTEFIYLRSPTIPDETSQYEAYRRVVEHMQGKPVVFRLLDIGGDKPALFQQLTGGTAKQENPALGLRGIRLLLAWPEVLEAQLRALLRASLHGPISIMIPMISTVEEVQHVRTLLHHCANELQISSVPSLGSMLEVPAAVMIADELAHASDFFSIGSNDLIQYCMAADRDSDGCGIYYTAEHPAIKKMIELTVQAARKAQIPVSICGELAGSQDWTQTFLDLGIATLSMTAERILPVRRTLSRLNYQHSG
jgi:phosphotransferase system enzyme I (PtsI)